MISVDTNFLTMLKESVRLFTPEFILVGTFLVAIIADLIAKQSKNIAAYISLIGFIITGYFLLQQADESSFTFANMLTVDPFANFFKILVLITSMIVVLMSFFSEELHKGDRSMGEYYSIIIGMTFGMFLLAEANNLIMIYLAVELMSISSYILAGYTKEIKRASEASLKYVIFGAVSSGIMIYGISLLFGLTGTMNLTELSKILTTTDLNSTVLLVSGIMIISGIGYKISAVPFHFWTPDVYEGAPVTITAYLSVASKAAGFAVLIRFLKVGYMDTTLADASGSWAMVTSMDWANIIAILAVLSMTIGNLVALWQTNIKRMLAYSSIAHAGYMLMAVVVMTDIGIAAIMVYFLIYMFMNLGAFIVVMLLSHKVGSEEIEDYTGIGYRAPILSICMVIFLISLTGLPPLAGFIGKWQIFTALLESDQFIWLAVVGVLNSVISLYYYVKVLRNMYLRGVDENIDKENYEFDMMPVALVITLAIPTVFFGVYPEPIINWAKNSVLIFLG